MGTQLRVISKSYAMNTNMTRFRWFSKILRPCALDESSLSIGRFKTAFVSTISQRPLPYQMKLGLPRKFWDFPRKILGIPWFSRLPLPNEAGNTDSEGYPRKIQVSPRKSEWCRMVAKLPVNFQSDISQILKCLKHCLFHFFNLFMPGYLHGE